MAWHTSRVVYDESATPYAATQYARYIYFDKVGGGMQYQD